MRNARNSLAMVLLLATAAPGQRLGADAVAKQEDLDKQILGLDAELKSIPACSVRDYDAVILRVSNLSKETAAAWRAFFGTWESEAGKSERLVRSDARDLLPSIIGNRQRQLDELRTKKIELERRQQRYAGAFTKDAEDGLKRHQDSLNAEIAALTKALDGLRAAEKPFSSASQPPDSAKLVGELRSKYELAHRSYEALLKSKQRAKLAECEATPD